MTVIFPRPNDPLLVPFIKPFSRMMFGYGRAMVAVREIVQTRLGSEDNAVKFMRGVKKYNLVEKVTGLCAPTLASDRLSELRACCEKLAALYVRRNRIVHGEWWFNVLGNSEILVRDWDPDLCEAIHDETVTPESLDRLAHEFTEVSSDLDMFTYTPDLNNAHPQFPD